MDLNDRLHKIASELFRGNKSAFARAAQVSITSAYKYLSTRDNVDPPGRVLGNLAKNLPQLNPQWLLTGEGEMIQDAPISEKPKIPLSIEEYKNRLEKMEERIEILRTQIALKDRMLAGLLRKLEGKRK